MWFVKVRIGNRIIDRLGREVMGISYNEDLLDKKGFLGDCLGEIDENLTSISDQVTIG